MKVYFTLFCSIFLLGQLIGQDTTATKSPCACCTEENNQFDFWIGNWKVYNKTGEKLLGTSQIKKIEENCVLQENWTSARLNYTGTSYNFYNKKTKKWEQLWLDNKGDVLKFEGNFINGSMVLSSKELTDPKGKKYINRITWTALKDGKVRQHWETTYNNGTDWTSVFDGYYQKKKNK